MKFMLYIKNALKKFLLFIKKISFLLIAIILLLINIPFRFDVDINTYGVLGRLNDAYEYEVLNVRINGTITRRIIRDGFGGGFFIGNFVIEGFDFLDGVYVAGRWRTNTRGPSAAFGTDRRGEPGIFVLRYFWPEIGPHLSIHGYIGFSSLLNIFAIMLFEPMGNNLLGWNSENGLFFAAPTQNLGDAKNIYWSFFIGFHE